MANFLEPSEVWPQIQELASESQTKKAAIAYVSSDAFVRFNKNDLLVLDASDDVIRNGLTSASVIQRAVMRGTNVITVPRLHAKVMVFDQVAVVGSANLSVHSKSQLLEAGIVTRQRSVTRKISRWIDDIGKSGQEVDEDLLGHLLSIESHRLPIQKSRRALGESHIVFFKEVKEGDIDKYNRQSSTSGTGGGARDLRFSPANEFYPVLSQIFSRQEPDPRATSGTVLSFAGGKLLGQTDVTLRAPTDSRPNEIRIARFYEVQGWAIDHEQLRRELDAGGRLFYVLEMDIHGTITAKVLTEQQLCQDKPIIADHIQELARSSRRRRAIIGAVDLVNNVTVP